MLIDLLRILGAVKNKKAGRHFVTHPTQVILHLSPNHGLFGDDGLYLESKISLEMLFLPKAGVLGWCRHWVCLLLNNADFCY